MPEGDTQDGAVTQIKGAMCFLKKEMLEFNIVTVSRHSFPERLPLADHARFVEESLHVPRR